MKKSLLALAVLGAFAGAASAQSSVTIYGIVDTSIAHVDQGHESVNSLYSGGDAASRIGFKGIEDLGNGLKAEFLLENGLDTSDGETNKAGYAFGRLAYVGLDGAFGKVRLGRQDTQLKELFGQIDPFGAAGGANVMDLILNGDLAQRNANEITWISNNYSGFSASASYEFGEVEGDNSANRGYGIRVGYANGPLNVQVAYENQNYTDPTVPVDADDKSAVIGATYDFGSFKLHGMYGERRLGANTDTYADPTNVDDKIRSGLIGVTVPFGANAIRAEYIRNDNRDVDNADNSVWVLSYQYFLSKRTHLYATYAHVSNDDNSQLGLGSGDFAADDFGQNVNGVLLGIQHKF